ncbi:MAG TPA: flagellar FlbD family protein [Chloroflexota bacterium]|nr:flagellar FlbD family protein [Chloroflexota bacterium]
MRVISVTRLDGSEFIINADLIETVEATPDTVITFAHDKKVVVSETPEEIVDRIVRYRHRVFVDPGALVSSPAKRPTAEQLSHMHKGTGARTNKRLHVVAADGQAES